MQGRNGLRRGFVDTWLSRQCGLFAPPCERSGAEIAKRGPGSLEADRTTMPAAKEPGSNVSSSGARIGEPGLHEVAERFHGEETEEVFRRHPRGVRELTETRQPGS